MKTLWKIKMALMLSLLWSFSATAVDQAAAKTIAHDDTGTYYIVQKGDTLWDISEYFLQSPWYWPEIWSVNSQVPILNPHLIFPGQRLRLFDRAGGTAMMPHAELSAEPPRIEALRYYNYPLIERVGFIQKEPEKPFGTIFKVRGNKEMISTEDIVFIQESAETPLTAGESYTVYRTSVPIYDREQEILVGIQHLITGTVEILKKADSYVMGKITQTFRPIRTGDQIMAMGERSENIPLMDAVPGLSAKIITSEERTYIMGEHDIAFIDKGAMDGVQVGQEYRIFEVDRVKAPVQTAESGEEIVVPVEVGQLLVLLTRPTVSTCLITRSLKSLQSGVAVDFPQP